SVIHDEVRISGLHPKSDFPCLTEEREPKLDLVLSGQGRTDAIEPPPTFPFLESQCQRAPSDVNFYHAREATPPARRNRRERRGRLI
ncbi:MAG: hypothetical protein KGO48_00145, partial [Alphaproteobacteria bacterium]|nr:hypothetical protein [Alphaproteobacteria bacterium]